MFTGIVERSLLVSSVSPRGDGIRVALPNVWDDVKLGESIALNGACMTVAELAGNEVAFDVVRESLDKTNLGLLKAGDEVHVERSLRLGDRIDGHMVQGHIDGTAELLAHKKTDLDWRMTVRTPAALSKYLIPKGSITIDGTSLTLAAIGRDTFEVALIPTTLEITRLGQRPIGWPLNLECDMMVKTIVEVVDGRMESLEQETRDRQRMNF